ncbi:unnamed protein product [Cuscuta campestris]|uniref:Uncharacterized protein n=1 Tax=Cuscuta campestris TaxID=132261 RepID=A0A484LJZ5_9ASTE|nr:unnamed protein product [Cuscuta campestris]
MALGDQSPPIKDDFGFIPLDNGHSFHKLRFCSIVPLTIQALPHLKFSIQEIASAVPRPIATSIANQNC